MKRILLAIIVLSVFLMNLTGCSAAPAENSETANNLSITMQIGNPVMTVNGEEKPIDAEGTSPVIVNNRTLLPVRAVVEAMGGSVTWDSETQSVLLGYKNDVITLAIGNTTTFFNEEMITLDVAPAIINNRTMLPIRYIAESFGFKVDWNDTTQTVTITNADSKQDSIDINSEASGTLKEGETVSKSIVIYFSQTGTTKPFAENIAKITNSDIYEIKAAVPYTDDDINYNNDNSRANKEQNDSSARPEIAGDKIDISHYDTVYLGYPIWWGTFPRIINTFIDTYDLSGKTIMPFCSSHSSGISSSVSAIKQHCPNSEVKDGLRGTGQTSEAEIKQWIDTQR